MKATLTYNLPEEYTEFRQATNASHYLYVIHQMDQRLRAIYKYGEDQSEEIREFAHTLRQELWQLRNEINDDNV